ncbi:hypothetical protein, partial [Burkholderia pseudomallei]|uniref:hypothetical protein n=1 Tax=Burkholderia pseudomallei TaxID=28450 RepID=UPI003CE7B9F3
VVALMAYVWFRGERYPQCVLFSLRLFILCALIWIVAGGFHVFGMSMATGVPIAGMAVCLCRACADTIHVRKRT